MERIAARVGTDEWRVLPAMIVRVAGFAFQRLAALRFPATVACMNALDTARAERASTGIALDREISEQRYSDNPAMDDPAVRKALSRHVKHVRKFARQELPDVLADSMTEVVREIPAIATTAKALLSAHRVVTSASADLERVFATELGEKRAVLRNMFDDVRLQESTFLESADAFDRIEQMRGSAGARDARARQRERLAMMYLQRFCAKNDTNSICGPLALAELATAERPRTISIATEGERRRTYFSHWAAESLWQTASDRTGVVTLALNPTARRDGANVAWCVIDHDATKTLRRRYRRATLPDEAMTIIEALEREPFTQHGGLDETAAELVEAGLITRVVLPPGLFYPLEDLERRLATWQPSADRDRSLAQIAELRGLVAQFERADLSGRAQIQHTMASLFEAATGVDAERGKGSHYADRSLLHEDCHAVATVEIGTETTSPLVVALGPLAAAASLPLELARENVREWFQRKFGSDRVPAMDVHRLFDSEAASTIEANTPRAAELRAAMDRVRACFASASVLDGVVSVVAKDLAIAATITSPRNSYLSADLMLRRDRAPNELVLGEVHGFYFMPTCLLDVAPEERRGPAIEQMREVMRTLAGSLPTYECLFAHTQATDRRFPMTDADLWIIDRGDRDGVGLGELDMQLRDDQLCYLRGDQEIVPLAVYTTYPFLSYTSKLAPTVDEFAGRFFPETLLPAALCDGDTPELAIDQITFRRKTWRRTASELQQLFATLKDEHVFVAARRLRLALGIAEVVFVSFADEPKPVLLDFQNFFLVETFAHLLSRQSPQSSVKMSEMFPGESELEALGPDGPRTSELRMGLYRLTR